MRKLLSLLGVLLLISFSMPDTELTEKERKFALDYLNETKQRLENNIKGLSEAQLSWKANDSTWSVANCIEHIALTEKSLFDFAMSTTKDAANPAKRSEIKYTDEAIMKFIVDRSSKAKAPEAARPSGKFGSANDALKVFQEHRETIINYMKDTKEDLRNHFIAHPFLGTIDTYQMILFITGHSMRHTLQLEEVKANPGFPKK